MTLRAKLWLGTGLLYALTLLMVGISFRSVKQLADSGTKVLKDNYLSLAYMHQVDSLCLSMSKEHSPKNSELILLNIHKQKQNVTEPGEDAATQKLAAFASQLRFDRNTVEPHVWLDSIRHYKGRIEQINLAAIQAKSAAAETKGEKALQEAIMLATIVLLLVVTLAVNMPAIIIAPIERLTKAVQQVAGGNYGVQVEESGQKDELGLLARAFNTMSEELAKYRKSKLEQILQSQRRTERIIGRLHEPLLVTDSDQNVLFCNDAAQRVLAMSDKEMIGHFLPELATKTPLLAHWLKAGLSQEKKPTSIIVDGQRHYFTLDFFTVDNEGQMLSQVLAMTDVTRFEELEQARADFLATVAHELKTPISSINLSAKLMASGKPGLLSTDQQQIVIGITSEGGRLLTLVNSLLELSRTESTAQKLAQAESVQISTLLQGLADKYKILAREKEITLQITPSQDLPAVLSVDGNKLELILSNLISNALRYVPNQTGIVALRAEKQDNKICFWVDDNGPGIPDPEKGRIFERFYKGAGGGTGLGLYIAKELAGQLQATLTLEPSKELGGASFAVCVG